MKKSHGLLSNILFYLNIWRRSFPEGLFYIVFCVPIGIAGIYSTINIPRLIIYAVEREVEIKSAITWLLIAFSVMTVSKVLLNMMETQLMTRGSRPLMWLYSKPIHDKLFHMDYQKLISAPVQNMLAKVENIVIRGGDGGPIHFFGIKLSYLLTSVVGMIVFASDIFSVDVLLIVIIILSALINMIYGVFSGRYSIENMRRRSETEKKQLYYLKVAEDRKFSKDIRFYGLLEIIQSAFGHYDTEYSSYLSKESNVRFAGALLNALTLFLRDGFAYFYLVHKLISGEVAVSQFVFLIALIIQFSSWMDSVVTSINELVIFSSQIEQLRDFIDFDFDRKHIDCKKALPVFKAPKIEFVNISFKYPESEKYIFKDFSLTIDSGEKLALVGINGAGKTTLVHLLVGLLEPIEGKILIDGKDSREFFKDDYFDLFSPVFQDICIFPESIATNVAGCHEYDLQRLESAFEKAGISEFVKSLENGADTLLVRDSSEKAIDLSGGMNQRLLLARAVYKDAPINILDEPTAALDPIAESKMYEEYEDMSFGKTSLFISHRLASTKFCDRIIFLEYGKIVEEGTHKELMELSGKYCSMYKMQSEYYKECVL